MLVGPEGGLSADEVEAATAAGFTAVGLGPRILRADTAAVAGAAIVAYAIGEI
jgi:16S rRNA (uracil1498-N3)-methyltransferase